MSDFGSIARGEAAGGAVGNLKFPVREIKGRCGDSVGFNLSIQLVGSGELNSVGERRKTDSF